MTMTPKELEYLAECEPIRIVPSFNMKPMNLISGNMGPFRAGIPCQVPLWMAINMSRRSKCKIVPPEWMCVETLRAVKKAERDSDFFTPMPSEHFMAIGKILFKECPGQIADCDEVKTLMKDIWDIRYAKLRKSVKIFLAQEKLPMMAQVDHLTMLEMCQIRPYLTHSLEQIHRVKQTVRIALGASQAQDSQNMSMSMSATSQSQSTQ